MQDVKERLTHVKGPLEPTEVKAAGKKRRLPDDKQGGAINDAALMPIKEGDESDNVNISPNCLLTPHVQILAL